MFENQLLLVYFPFTFVNEEFGLRGQVESIVLYSTEIVWKRLLGFSFHDFEMNSSQFN